MYFQGYKTEGLVCDRHAVLYGLIYRLSCRLFGVLIYSLVYSLIACILHCMWELNQVWIKETCYLGGNPDKTSATGV